MRMIDADRLKAEIMGWCVVTDDLFGMRKYHEREIVLQAIEESPAIDAVPVVRCRECKHNRNCFIKEMIIAETKQDNPYCSCGAKMEDKP